MTDPEAQAGKRKPGGTSPDDANPEARRALDQLIERQYDRLKKLAARIRWSDSRASLNATALLNEAYIKLSKTPADLGGKHHDEALGIIANVMRQILIDQARNKGALKRGRGNRPVPLDEAPDVMSDVSALSPEDVLTLAAARDQLARSNPRMAKILDCRFYLGMTADETALALSVSKTTVEREGREARNFLRSRLRPAGAGGS